MKRTTPTTYLLPPLQVYAWFLGSHKVCCSSPVNARHPALSHMGLCQATLAAFCANLALGYNLLHVNIACRHYSRPACAWARPATC